MTCVKAQGFLAKQKTETLETVDAKKKRFTRKEALDLARKADELYAAKGKKVVHLNLKKDKLSDDDLAALIIGPSGNLRAPSFFVGKTLIVGFDESTYKQVLS